MAYLIAATVITLSVLEGNSPIASLFQVRYFVFVAHRAVHLHLQSFLLWNSICGLFPWRT